MSSSGRLSGEIVGRAGELEELTALLEAASEGDSGVLVLRGEPGIGKTTLLATTRARAQEEFRVLSVTGVEGESDIPYAALLTLLAPLTGYLDSLPERQRSALAGVLALGPATAADALSVGVAVLALLDAAAEERPVLAIVDDAHWLDSASAKAILFAARRLGAERVAVLVGLREAEGVELDTAGIDERRLAGLDIAAARELLARAAATTEPSGQVVEALVHSTAGNPLALLELARALNPGQLEGHEPLDEPVAVGPRLRSAFLRRAEALSQEARSALLVAAAAAGEQIEPVAAALNALGIELDRLQEGEQAGLVELTGDAVRFRHPLIRAAVYHGADPVERRRAHRALAGAEDSPLLSAWHLADAAVGPDEATACALEDAAVQARDQGAAAAAHERAALLTPERGRRAARLVRAAEQRLLAGSAQRAVELAGEALALDPERTTRAEAEQVLSRLELLRGSLEAAHDRGVRAAELVEHEDPDAAVAMLLEAGLPGFMSGQIEQAVVTMQRAYDLAKTRPPDIRTAPTVLYGAALTIAGRFEEGRPLLDQWLAVHAPDRMLVSPPELIGGTQSLTWIEEYDACLEICNRVIELARALGAAGPLQLALGQRAEVHYRLGRWPSARADASESIRLAEATGQSVQATFPMVVLGRLETASGLDDQAQTRTTALVAAAAAAGMGSMAAYTAATECLGHLGAGDPERAADAGRRVRELVEGFGMLDPSVLQWRADFIEALVKSGQVSEARAELNVFAEQARRTGRSWPLAAVARCRGLLAGDDDIDATFEQAQAWHAHGDDPFERARTQLAWGERLRRARHPARAREPLRTALGTFEDLGAQPWARRARTELRAAGGALPPARRAASLDLTAQELEVAMLVARGATNREAAAALFVSPKTVEAHLSRTYRKLGVRSRTELAAAMGDELRARDDGNRADPA